MKLDFKNTVFKYDWILLINVLAICLLSILIVGTATSSSGTTTIVTKYSMLQLLWVGVGLVAMTAVSMIDYRFYAEKYRWFYFGINIVLLGLLLLGTATRGTVGWIKVIGERTIQPSELAKITIIITLAKVVADKMGSKGKIEKFSDLIPIMGYFIIPFVLILLQPDWGTAFVFVCILAGILFVAKTSWKIILTILGTGVAALPIAWIFMASWQKDRIITFFNPASDTTGAGLQVTNAKLVIGSGGLTGKGLFAEGTLSKLGFLPDCHTDFIFSVMAETFGFIGALILVILYITLILRMMYLASKAHDTLGCLMIVGVAAMFMFHIFENIGMNIGLMPVTGIPLPFMSYGGSSMLANFIAIGLVQNVSLRRDVKKQFNEFDMLKKIPYFKKHRS